MSADKVYVPSPIKHRATKAEMKDRRVALLAIVREMQPMTVRQVFYQATVRGIVEKAETGYRKVQTDLVAMRRSGALPFGFIADNTRWQRRPQTYDGIEHALHETARFYRKALWTDISAYVEIWCEKDALAGVINPVTDRYDVPLMVARGYSSLSFLHSAASYIASLDRPAYIYHFGDYDPSGVDAARKIEAELRNLAPDAEIYFERVAVTTDQIERLALPTRPTKASDSRAARFGAVSVELDAIEPDMLRTLVEDCINDHLPADQLATLEMAETSEREALAMFAGSYSVDGI